MSDADQAGVSAQEAKIESDRQLILDAQKKGLFAKLGVYTRLSGPGWLQSAITLGGGSLSSSLYLGVLGGFALLWLQPLAMIIGIIMLSAIAYVTLSTGEKPFRAINQHVSPVLGWGWLLATMAANCVWSLPQFSLACGAFRQNLLPGVFGTMAPNSANAIVAGAIALVCITMVFFYDSGGAGVKLFDVVLKLMVAIIVVSFFGVVVYMTAKGALDWSAIGKGLIPDVKMLWSPAATFDGPLTAVAGEFRSFWSDRIVSQQQDVLISAAATAVGINMTFLLPYSMLKRGWNKTFRGLAAFDLSTGLFIPFILATGCVVIASASRFHTTPAVHFPAEEAALKIAGDPNAAGRIEAVLAENYADRLAVAEGEKAEDVAAAFAKEAGPLVTAELAKPALAAMPAAGRAAAVQAVLAKAQEGKLKAPNAKLMGGYKKIAEARLKAEIGAEAFGGLSAEDKAARLAALPLADRRLAAMIVKRDSVHLAGALAPLTGPVVAHYVFGIGVVGMAISSIIILMLINGFCVCEMFDRPSKGWLYRVGCLIPAVGILGPFIWSEAAPYLAIPTSVFGFILIPIAYSTFALVLNNRKLLGDNMPKGLGRWAWNLFMLAGVGIVLIGSVYMAWKKTEGSFVKSGWVGVGAIGAFIGLALVVHFVRKAKAAKA